MIVGEPVHVPVEAVNVFSSFASPEIVGTTVFTGAVAATVAVAADVAVASPTPFFAVTFTLIVCPTSSWAIA